jgi:hypothetical protein
VNRHHHVVHEQRAGLKEAKDLVEVAVSLGGRRQGRGQGVAKLWGWHCRRAVVFGPAGTGARHRDAHRVSDRRILISGSVTTVASTETS